MKILTIIGSPHRGNTLKVVQEVERQLQAREQVEFEYLFLNKVNLQPCTGCYLCVRKGEELCPQKDDRDTILEKMKAADGVIFASPVYTLTVSALMKNFMDRIAYNAHRPPFLGKPAMLVATTAGTGLEGGLGCLSWFAIPGFEIAAKLGVVYYPSHPYKAKGQEAIDRKIEKASQKFWLALRSPAPRPGLIRVIQFNALKANATFGQASYPADFRYYQNREHYHTGADIGFIKRLLGRFFFRMSLGWMNANLEK
jgi:NAD(P)H-dependent FMN reductase